MKLNRITDRERKALRNLKALQGRTITYDELKEMLFGIAGTSWAHSDEDYCDEGSDEGYFMIHSLDDIECEEPYVLPDGTQTHINMDPVWEIFFINHDDKDGIGLEDTVTVDEVSINVPEYLFI